MRLKHRRHNDCDRAAGRWRLYIDVGIAAAIFALVFVIVAHIGRFRDIDLSGPAKIVDGDTLRLSGQRVRLQGLDAPEIGQLCEMDSQSYRCGRKARDFLEALTAGKTVRCRGRDFDRYGRLLADCHVGTLNLNARIVSAGWAVSYGGYHGQEKDARQAGRGLWAGSFDWPADWRATGGIPPGAGRGFFAGARRAIHRLFGVADD